MKKTAFVWFLILGVAISSSFAQMNLNHRRHGSDSLEVKSAPAKPRKHRKNFDCHVQVGKAIAKYNKHAYEDVKTILDDVRMECGGSSIIDTVRYYLGMTYLKTKGYIDAQTEFEQVTQNYPNSAYAEECHFRTGECSFLDSHPYNRDQTKTIDAIRQLNEFIDLYPSSAWVDSARSCIVKCHDKLAHKEFDSARFYTRIREYEAAAIYYKIVLSDFPASAYVPESKYYLAESLAKVHRISESLALLDDIAKSGYADDINRKASLLRSKIQTQQ
jgi:outer membrane assembly lipoprotein YfiO